MRISDWSSDVCSSDLNFYDAEKIEAYLDTAPEMLRYLETHSEVLLTSSTIPDYSPDAPGWKTGRCLLTADYDGEKLGADFDLLRPPIPEMGLFHSMKVSPADADRKRTRLNSRH